MPYATNFGDAAFKTTIKLPAAVTADGLSSAIDISAYEGEILVGLVSDAGSQSSGSDRTMACKLVESDASGGTYTDVTGGGFTAQTTTAVIELISLNSDELKGFLKLNMDIGGTNTPTYTLGAFIIGNKKNPG